MKDLNPCPECGRPAQVQKVGPEREVGGDRMCEGVVIHCSKPCSNSLMVSHIAVAGTIDEDQMADMWNDYATNERLRDDLRAPL
jgi:hypothetical protein